MLPKQVYNNLHRGCVRYCCRSDRQCTSTAYFLIAPNCCGLVQVMKQSERVVLVEIGLEDGHLLCSKLQMGF